MHAAPAALAAHRNKTDRNDAHDIAILLSRGFDAATRVKSAEALHVRAQLLGRRMLKMKARDLEGAVRGFLKTFGARLHKRGETATPAARLGHPLSPTLRKVVGAMLRARAALPVEAKKLDADLKEMARSDALCRCFMTAPGVRPLTALTVKAAIDDPARFPDSRVVGALKICTCECGTIAASWLRRLVDDQSGVVWRRSGETA